MNHIPMSSYLYCFVLIFCTSPKFRFVCLSLPDLLNIKPSPNNGSYGALRDLLDPEFASKLGPPRSMSPLPGTLLQCSFPREELELVNRSLCEDCVCRSASCNLTDAEIVSTNRNLLNLSAPISKTDESSPSMHALL